jgi:tetratricopeptide (TPR) repeat protein
MEGTPSQAQELLYNEKIRKYKTKERIYSFSSLTVILLAIILFLFSNGRTIPFSKHDWVVISDFENLTRDPDFDKSIYTAFTLSISQSRYFNVLSRTRMIENLQRMKFSYKGFIDENTAREIAVREGINLLVAPSISQVGKRFIITYKIVESKTGNLLRSIVLKAEDKDDILQALDRLSRSLRRELGESRYRITLQDKPLVKVTTSSLPALKQYSLGIESNYRQDFSEAKSYYENALRIDTDFVAAKASLGNINYEKFDSVVGKKLLNEVVRSADNLTDKEKYGIRAFYAINVEHNLTKGIENEKILIGLYPDDPAYHHNLGWYYQKAKRYEEAADEYKTAVRLNPKQALSYGGLLWTYLECLGKADSAYVWSNKMIANFPQNSWAYYYLGSACVCLDSLERGAASFTKAMKLNPNFLDNRYRLAHAYRAMGQYTYAIQVLEKINEVFKDEISVYYDIGVNYQGIGDKAKADRYFKVFKEKATSIWVKQFPNLSDTYIALSAVSSRLNETAISEQMLKKALLIDSTNYFKCAEVYCLQGKIEKAIDQIEKTLASGFRDLYMIKTDVDLQPLQTETHFRELLKKYF